MSIASSPIPCEQVVDRVRGLWEEGQIKPTGHFKDRLKERNFSLLDIEEALFSSECSCTKVTKDERGWRYVLEGFIEDKQRERIAFVLTVDVKNALVSLITCFSKGEL